MYVRIKIGPFRMMKVDLKSSLRASKSNYTYAVSVQNPSISLISSKCSKAYIRFFTRSLAVVTTA